MLVVVICFRFGFLDDLVAGLFGVFVCIVSMV